MNNPFGLGNIQGETVYEGETDKWFIRIAQVDNYIKINVEGKRDHRSRVIWWRQSRRLFPKIRDEDDE